MSTPEHAEQTEKAAEAITTTTLVVIYFALLALLGLTLLLAYPLPQSWGLAVGMAIAVAKTALIVLFYMHVWYESSLVKVFAFAAFLWFCIFLLLTMGDYVARAFEIVAL